MISASAGPCDNGQALHDEKPQGTRTVPGATASTVHPFQWWDSAFRFIVKMNISLSKFFSSFHRKPAIPSSLGNTAVIWPMPVPYPFEWSRNSGNVSASDSSFRRGVNLCVIILSWLHLRRPCTCPAEIVFGVAPTRLQWKVIRQIERSMAAWKHCEPVTSELMGRTASKVEDMERIIARLSVFESEAASWLDEVLPENSGVLPKPCFSQFAPGLQKTSGGVECGSLPGADVIVAKKIESDRLDFRGRPDFQPSQFLDPKGRSIFERPLDHCCKPEEAREIPPTVRIHASQKELWLLLRKLDSSGRLGLVRETELLQGYQAGLFCVLKDGHKDRLIFDCRPMNTLESPPRRWVASMASAANLLELELDEGFAWAVSGTDLREFYYSFAVSHQRLIRNALLAKADPYQLLDFQCFDPSLLSEKRPVYFGLRTLAMGDSCAVELAQTAHVGILHQLGLYREDNMVCMNMALPRSPRMIGVVIDDLILLERVAIDELGELSSAAHSSSLLETALARYHELGLIPHPGKTFFAEGASEFWGAAFDGVGGFVRASLKRCIPIMFVTTGILKIGLCSLKLLEVVVGCWTSMFMFRRRLLSVLNVCYEPLHRECPSSSIIRLSPALKEELLMCISLVPLACTCLRAKNSPHLYASDASDWGWAVVRSKLPNWLQSEVHRHKLRKSVWAKFLSPLKASKRIRGALPPAEELPPGEGSLSSHPLYIELATAMQFEEVQKGKTRDGAHINVGEVRGLIRAERAAVDEHFPVRSFCLADSMVALGVWVKGRSSSPGLNQELQQSLPIHLGCGAISNAGYIPTEVNAADDPTRHARVRSPIKSCPDWLKDSSPEGMEGILSTFDSWLSDYSATPLDLSGLPPLSELSGFVPDDLSWSKKKKSKTFFSRHLQPTAASDFGKCGSLMTAQHGSSFLPEPSSGQAPLDFSLTGVGSPELESNDLCEANAEPLQKPLRDPVSEPSEKPPGSGFNPPIVADQIPSLGDFAFPTAASKNLTPLSSAALSLLGTVSRSQFVFPSAWKLPPKWIPDFGGHLDLYSGAKGVARELVKQGGTWAITFELEDDIGQDVLLPGNQTLIRELIELGCVITLGAAIFCHSFSRAVRPPVRSALTPEGNLEMSQKTRVKVDLGNDHSKFLASLIELCLILGVIFFVENPDLSFLWRMPEWKCLGALMPSQVFRLDYCTCGTPWRKRTRILTNSHLRGQCCFCKGGHSHLRLVGWSRIHGKPWTRVAQVYPRRLCQWLAKALLVDSKGLPERRRVDTALLAKLTPGRVGEASHPGPRGSGRFFRDASELDAALLVEPTTNALGATIWIGFKSWCEHSISRTAFIELSATPATLCVLIEMYGRHLFSSGKSLYILRQLVTYAQREQPSLRGQLGSCWQLISRWHSLEPLRHRTPLPLIIFQAMVAVALLWKWTRWAGVTMLAFEGICRPGEPLKACRKDLLLPVDLVVEGVDVCYLRIINPKGRRRGIGAVQHVKLQEPDVVGFLSRHLGSVGRDVPLYPGSPASYRKRWDAILRALLVPKKVLLTPASLRAGGAVKAYRSDEELTKLMWRMRIRNIDTLQHYLQEVGAATVYAELPRRSQDRIQSLAVLYSSLVQAV